MLPSLGCFGSCPPSALFSPLTAVIFCFLVFVCKCVWRWLAYYDLKKISLFLL